MFYFTFNNRNNVTLGVEVVTRPSIPAPQLRGEYIQIAGRDGSLFQTDGSYENIEINITLNFFRPPNEWGDTYRQLKAWINGPGILRFSDDSSVFYKVKYSGISEMNRKTRYGAIIEATFILDPFTYLDSGTAILTPQEAKLNPYYLSKPTYYITGQGTATLTVNGNTMTALVGGNLTIDTERMVSYRENGPIENTSVTGYYDDLYLLPGENEISITNGFTLKVKPNYRSL